MCLMNKVTYLAIIEKTKDGFSAYFPDLPGCISIGDTLEKCIDNVNDTLNLLDNDSRRVELTSLYVDDSGTGKNLKLNNEVAISGLNNINYSELDSKYCTFISVRYPDIIQE